MRPFSTERKRSKRRGSSGNRWQSQQSTSFDQRVYALVAQIPLAPGHLRPNRELLGCWGCARQVGWALRRLQLPSEVPWQRVVNAKGCISFRRPGKAAIGSSGSC